MNEIYKLAKKYFIWTLILIVAERLLLSGFLMFSPQIILESVDSAEKYMEIKDTIYNTVSTVLEFVPGLIISLLIAFELKEERRSLFPLIILTFIEPIVGIVFLIINRYYKFEISQQYGK